MDEIARGRTAEEGRVPRERSKEEEEEEKTRPRSRGPAARPSTPPTSFFIFFPLTHAHTQTPPPGAPPAAPATDVRLITSAGSVRLPLLGLAVGGDTPAEAIEAGLGAGVARWEVRSEAAAARFGAALASAPPPPGGVAGLALTARIPAPASPDAALAAVDAILAAAGVGALALLLIEWGPPPDPGGPPRPGPGLLPAWAAAGAVVAAGKAAALGLADAGLADVEAVLAAAKEAGGAGAAAAAAAGRAPPPPPPGRPAGRSAPGPPPAQAGRRVPAPGGRPPGRRPPGWWGRLPARPPGRRVRGGRGRPDARTGELKTCFFKIF